MDHAVFSILDGITNTTDSHKRKLYTIIESKMKEWDELERIRIAEEKRWRIIRIKQLKEENEREEHDRIAKEKFEKETLELAYRKRRCVLRARQWLRQRKRHFIKLRNANISHKREKHDAKSESDLVAEIVAKETADDLRKWLFRNLSLALAPKEQVDPQWRIKNKLLQEIILSKKDLNKLKKIAEKYKPEWTLYFRY
jgi:hypothetical protein